LRNEKLNIAIAELANFIVSEKLPEIAYKVANFGDSNNASIAVIKERIYR